LRLRAGAGKQLKFYQLVSGAPWPMDVFKVYTKLFKIYGPQNWWPVKYAKNNPAFEIAVGAILTQNTSWRNVEKALACLHQNKLLSPAGIINCPTAKLQKCLRPSGYFKQKAKKLKIFSRWLMKCHGGSLNIFFKQPLASARPELLSLWGIGPETADSILLYAGHKTIFVIDAYTKRLCDKFSVKFKTYCEYQNFFESKLPKSEKLYNQFHALIVASGKDNHFAVCNTKLSKP
jgi:endonuclease-3 related protein